jgi:hypothetical protein
VRGREARHTQRQREEVWRQQNQEEREGERKPGERVVGGDPSAVFISPLQVTLEIQGATWSSWTSQEEKN